MRWSLFGVVFIISNNQMCDGDYKSVVWVPSVYLVPYDGGAKERLVGESLCGTRQ